MTTANISFNTMEFQNLLEYCQTLEGTISLLHKSNSKKEAEIIQLHRTIYENANTSLLEWAQKEREIQEQVDTLKFRKIDLETRTRQFSDINDKLAHLVSIVQQSDEIEEQDTCKNEEISQTIDGSLEDYEQIRLEYIKLVNRIDQMDANVRQDAADLQALINENQRLVIEVERNDNILRLSEQQSIYADQQFDLIINQLPWEPLSEDYIDQLRNSNDQKTRDLPETLQLQKSEIDDLNEALSSKKTRNLEVLQQLYDELMTFVNKREEAIMVTRFIEGA